MQIVTLALPILVGIVAIVVGIIKIIEFCRDRIRINVSAEYICLGEPAPAASRQLVRLTAVNQGKRPVSLDSAYLIFSDGGKLSYKKELTYHSNDDLPCLLQDGESCSVHIPAQQLREKEAGGSKAVAVAFRDASNREYRSSFRPDVASEKTQR